MRSFLHVLCAVAFVAPAVASEINGIPRIVDGDTVEIASTKIRLFGIDAPETDQLCIDGTGQKWACGIASRDALAVFSSNRPWACSVTGEDRYGRSLASCAVASKDVSQWMVRSGWALAFVKYSDRYIADDAAARASKAGLWAGAFIAPWDWRSRNKQTLVLGAIAVPANAQTILLGAVSSQEAPDPRCTIKAGVSRGECIYHLAGDRWYAKMKMNKPDRRWFCTPEEAVAAGCRPPKR
ncbi:thermonuclease family protein [Nitrobacter winogradskyi]|uniref:Endonuclease YncB(Thermonuclease family) n=2 Tax=Nitrobacter winogradskyi TaxID=913 RepID=A0ACC6AH17_NITWI|nr:thermonuclease family protein [Nitrobacter winogradskyi]MCP1998994.1 endonuclease YncB(thermonuclease family) [Nitrobacter winogradskyi]GEC16487.1 nuclease [Nitrobacter winogradskyi]